MLTSLIDLVLPTSCGGCGEPPGPDRRFGGVCPRCVTALDAVAGPVRPTPAPPGLPPCVALAEYHGPLRELILSYKDRGRRDLARPLGAGLARAVLAAAGTGGRPLILVPVPDTAAAARARLGDHMLRLTRHAAISLRGSGRRVRVARPVWARPRVDSTHLDRAGRADAAEHAFAVRAWRVGAIARAAPGTVVLVLDDVLTTGATLAAVSNRLAAAGVEVSAGITLAATRLRFPPEPNSTH